MRWLRGKLASHRLPRRLTEIERRLDNLFIETGRLACQGINKLDRLDSLADAEFRVSSQWGEDGIIEWLVYNLAISNRSFVEFGVEDYRESNTRFLLQNRNWRGLVLDSSATNIARIKKDPIYWRHELTAASAFITRENINGLIEQHGFAGEIGLLSIDIDGNDFWVWQAIEIVNPVIVVCEYNAVLGDVYPVTAPYRADFDRTRAHHSNLYYGASIEALRLLGQKKGYVLLGSNSTGSNAFFVRKSEAANILDRIRTTDPQPSHIREARDQAGKLTFLSGMDRISAIAHLTVQRVDNNDMVTLGSLPDPYSPAWVIGVYR